MKRVATKKIDCDCLILQDFKLEVRLSFPNCLRGGCFVRIRKLSIGEGRTKENVKRLLLTDRAAITLVIL